MSGVTRVLERPTTWVDSPDGFNRQVMEALARRVVPERTITVERNTNIYLNGDDNRYVYVVRAGRVKTVVVSRSGKECLLDIHTVGDVFGETALLHQRRPESAVAMDGAVLSVIRAQTFLELLTVEGMIGPYLRYLAHRLEEHEQTIRDMVTDDCEQCLGMTLLRLGRKLGKRDTHQIRIDARITQEELSGMVGTTRTRIGQFLKRFRDVGGIEDAREFIVINEPRLSAYLDSRATRN